MTSKQLLLVCLCIYTTVNSFEPEKGNFALPASQQPGPLFSRGQNTIDKGDLLLQETWNGRWAPSRRVQALSHSLVYGPFENFSILFSVPNFPSIQTEAGSSSGIGDILVQTEYTFLNIARDDYSIEATVLNALSFPTGSTQKTPPTGFGEVTVLVGSTLSYTSICWYSFVSTQAIFRTEKEDRLFKNTYFYDLGIGHNLGNPSHSIVGALLELNGIYAQAPKSNPAAASSHVIFLGPSLSIATPKLLIAGGVQFPIFRDFTNPGLAPSMRAALFLQWKFNS